MCVNISHVCHGVTTRECDLCVCVTRVSFMLIALSSLSLGVVLCIKKGKKIILEKSLIEKEK